eukprot:CAMPEP_0198731168 /NCGR_PEP_ID=MMETSP1475-20131203/28473_1 /TAXON_ID= ORGANISM="Unidentified sp., Strain CCMP1999" /NCGR_SAMPLE_ID=MMETSP1475 /ASSEMBLY_ACC=CAM_ASM_001111 /LENGTH=305 /DNA_ID=CAMNT_0044494095 /DNA_START=65 /DNA_END=982 /DNA_ORIENTATION=-
MELEDGALWMPERLTPTSIVQHGLVEVLEYRKTKYQTMVIGDTGNYGKALFLDGHIQTTEKDEHMYHEPIVHIPSILHESPRKVLILGGADLGAAREALRWRSVQKVVIVDIDQEVVDGCKRHLSRISQGALDDERCNLLVMDALKYMEDPEDKFDVIIGDLTDPEESGPSRSLFTVEFYEMVKRCLTPEGVYVTQSGTASLDEDIIFSRVTNTLKAAFKNVLSFQSFIPTYYTPLGFNVASDHALDLQDRAKRIDDILEEGMQGGQEALRALDGVTFSAFFALPKQTRERMAQETVVFRQSDVN